MMMSSSSMAAGAGSSELIYRGGHDAPAADEAGARYSSSAKPPPPPHGNKPWLARPLRYVMGEQRLAFALLGMALASLVFLLAPSGSGSGSAAAASSGTTRTSSSVAHLAAVGLASRQYSSRVALFEEPRGGVRPGRVPLGLKRKGLRVVVTGGAGFVGSHLVDRLLARGDSVIVVDNLFTGRKENVLHHAGNPRFEMIRHDVVEPILLEVDQIYHLACPASPVHYKHNPVKTIKTNVVGTLNMLGLAKRVGARFLLTSTSEVYGDPLQHPQVETYWGNVNPIGVRSCYDEGKRTAETLTMDYHRGANLEVRIARIFNTYGPRMCIDDGRVVSNFVAQALRKEPLTVYGDGKQTRSFQYVSDLVEGLMKLMEGEHVGPFNLGNPGEFTMLELAKVVQDTIDPNARIEFRPNTADDPHKRKPDITRAKDLLGWEPKIPLTKGLPLMVQDFRNRIFGDQQQKDANANAGDN
ncbi:hypothetical protein SEVIR_2G442000v4 [Setaria viridis]|uniref:UDP-glucuronate decarboxylase n=1 Tax=Setaria viridis TaxID=4556 RepID=A0A4U6W2A9_SETVI|nr:UDP-glucuronic acid decarboxylase 2-like [Setaria viridis]TKW36471.1 hypothetical protein SEVIR_2G442000v2 [Setaria viridis]